MEDTESKVIAVVKSPSMDAHKREGNGFSLREIKEAGKTITDLKSLGIKIDYFRKSNHPENIELLKTVKLIEKKGKKRKPFTPKEKKVKSKPFKPKKKMRPAKVEKPKAKPAKKKVKAKEAKGEVPLTELDGLGPATAKKFQEIGVTSVKDLIKEDPKELGLLIKGCSEDRIRSWIEDGKKLVK